MHHSAYDHDHIMHIINHIMHIIIMPMITPGGLGGVGPWVGVPGLRGLAPFGAGSGGWAGGPGFPSSFGDVSRRWGLGVPGWPWSAVVVVVVCRRRPSLGSLLPKARGRGRGCLVERRHCFCRQQLGNGGSSAGGRSSALEGSEGAAAL